MIILRLKTVFVILLTLVTFAGKCWALHPNEIALIVNSSFPESQQIAQYYCQKRQVPIQNIISLPMTTNETVSRQTYEEKIAPIIRQRLNQPDMVNKIKCLVTIYGVPLKIAAFQPKGLLAKKRNLLIRLLDERFDQLQKLTEDLKALTSPATPIDPEDKKFRLSRSKFQRQRRALDIYKQALQTGKNAQQTIDNPNAATLGHQRKSQKFDELIIQWYGLQGKAMNLTKMISQAPQNQQKQTMQEQLKSLEQQLKTLTNRLQQIKQLPPDINLLEEGYELLYRIIGLRILCHPQNPNGLLAHRRSIGDDDSLSAFDSEISLILWDTYPLDDQQPNLLYAYADQARFSPPQENNNSQPTLMVARLDGPNAQIARSLIDKAIDAESLVLNGNAYIDAQGKHQNIKQLAHKDYFDEKLRQTADLLIKNTNLNVILDDLEPLFPIDACPNTILYCGWYSLEKYIDSFQFNPGAVGYHIASFEAKTLGRSNPNSNVWCKRMLENGITATLGPVAEPYLHSFPQPNLFFSDLISGKYSLVECFYRTKPFNSWRQILIGDPLYRPRYARKDQPLEPIKKIDKITIPPISPQTTKPKEPAKSQPQKKTQPPQPKKRTPFRPIM